MDHHEGFKCSICSKVFSRRCDLTVHNKKNSVTNCIPSPKQNYFTHLAMKHPVLDLNKPKREEGFKCSICSKVFSRRCDLTVHNKKNCNHSDPKIKKTYSCSICLKVLSRNEVKKHILKVHGVQCKICQEIVKDKTMEEHIALLHLIKCRFCSKKIAQGGDMKAHIASVHGIIKCQICQEKLTYKNMHHHMKVFHKKISKDQLSTKVHKITNKKFECPLCSTIFSSHQERAKHKKLKH